MTVLGRSYQVAAPPLETRFDVGVAAIAAEAARLSALADAIPGTPITARWPWVSASVNKPAPYEQPWLISVTAGNELVAAAVLLDDVSGSVRRTSLAGTAENHRGALLALDEQAGVQLGATLAQVLMSELREFNLGPLSQGPALATLLFELPIGLVVDEVSVPVVRTTEDRPAGMSHGMTRTLRKAQNRMAADGLTPEIAVTGDRHEITGILPLLESISRDRDHAGGRPSPLDNPAQRRLWHRRVLAMTGSGALRLATLRFNGELAAYVLGIEDGSAYRVLEGRYVARWARYSPGRVLEAAVLDGVAAAPSFELLDWMTAVAPETLLAANDVDPLVIIRGRS
jgi:Acetyltransferase (GNAT) domain